MQNISKARITSKFNLISFNLPNPNHTYLYSLIKYLNKHDHFLKLRFSVMVSYFRKFQSSYNFSQKYFENFLVRIRKIQFENFMFQPYLLSKIHDHYHALLLTSIDPPFVTGLEAFFTTQFFQWCKHGVSKQRVTSF